MGQVFLAEDLKLQRRAALKLINPTLTQDETRRQRFVQEARVAASIDHPHIAAIYDIDEVDGRTYIAGNTSKAARCARCSRLAH